MRSLKQLTRAKISVLILLLMTPLSTSCENIKYVYVKHEIPTILLAPCEKPELIGNTYADVIKLAYRQKIALEECNLKIKSIAELNDK